MSRFAVHVHQLTQPHLTGGQEQEPLLTRLRAATTPGNDGGQSDGGDKGSPIPIDPTALDLFTEIEKEARTEYRHYRGCGYVGTLENLLHHLIAPPFVDMPDDWDDYLTGKAQGWIDSILGLLNPKKPRRRLHRPCPSCGVKYHGLDRKPALTLNCWDEAEEMLHPSLWDASCAACGAEWRGDEVQWLSRTLAAA